MDFTDIIKFFNGKSVWKFYPLPHQYVAYVAKWRLLSVLACVASVFSRVRRESWDESKKRNDGGGGGEYIGIRNRNEKETGPS